MRSAKAELRGGGKRSGSLRPRIGACDLRRSNQDEDEEKKRGSRLHRRRMRHICILLLPHLGCCNRTRCICVRIVRSDLRCNRKGHQQDAEQRRQQIQSGLASGMNRNVHRFQDTLSWAMGIANTQLQLIPLSLTFRRRSRPSGCVLADSTMLPPDSR